MAHLKALEILWIVLLRFNWPARIWAMVLIAINLEALFYLDTVYGQIVLGAALMSVVVMIVIYLQVGFVRLLGIGHVFWVPMLIWIAFNLPDFSAAPGLHLWVLTLFVLNSISLVIDTSDVIRYLRGEREPHYVWTRESPSK